MITKPCPKCGAPLVERTNRDTGAPFWGCSQYPQCAYTQPVPESVKLRKAGQRGMFDEEERAP
jgi:ssDNA-binding Zn-finger/Zn-ribbon topoisomerase 1